MHAEAAMPCEKKNPSHFCFQETVARLGAPNKIPKTKYACVVESHESTRQKMEPTLQRGHEDHIASQGEKSTEPLYSRTQIHSGAESDKNIGRKGSGGKRMGQGGQEQERGYSGSTEKQEQTAVICDADELSSVNTAYALTESSFTISPRSTTRPLYFWNLGCNLAFLR